MHVKTKRFEPTQLVLRSPDREPFATEEGSNNSYLKYLGRVLFNQPQPDTQGHVYGGGFVNRYEPGTGRSNTTSSPLSTFQYTQSGFGFSNGSLQREFIPLCGLGKHLTKSHQLIHMDSLVLTNIVNLALVVYDTETFVYQVLLFNTLSQEVTKFPLQFENPVTCFSCAVIPACYYCDSTPSNLEHSSFQGNSRIQLVLGLQTSLILGYDFEIRRDATQTSSTITKVSGFSHQLLSTVVLTCLNISNYQNPTEFTVSFGGQGGKFGVLRYGYHYTNSTPILKSVCNSFGLESSFGNFKLILSASPITFMEYLPSLDHSDPFSYLLVGQGSQPFLIGSQRHSQRHSPQFSLIRLNSDLTEVNRILQVSSSTGSVGSLIKASISYHETGSYLTLSRWNGSPQPKLQISISHLNWAKPQFDPIFEAFVSSDSSDVPLDVHVDTRSGTFKVLYLNSISDPIHFCSTALKIRDISSKYLLHDFIKLVTVGLANQNEPAPTPKNGEAQSLFQSLAGVRFPTKCGSYPIVSLEEASELANFINDSLSPIKNHLFYYMLLDYPLPIERTTFARNHQITEAQCMLLKGYWNIDHGHYLEGVNNLCSSKLNPRFPHQILDLLIGSGQTKAICLFWDFLGQINLKISPKTPRLLVKVLFQSSLRTSIQFIATYPDVQSKNSLYSDFFSLVFEPGYLTPARAGILRLLISSEVEEHLLYFMSTLVGQDSPRCKDQFRSAFHFYLDYLIGKKLTLEAVDFYRAHRDLAAAFGITTMPSRLEEALTKLTQVSPRSLLVGSVSTQTLKRPSDGSRSYSEIKVAKLSASPELSPKRPFFSTLTQQPPGLSLRESYQKVGSGLSEAEVMPLTPRSPKFIRPLDAFDLPKSTLGVPVYQISLPVECESTKQITESVARDDITHTHSQDIISISSGSGSGSDPEHQVGNGYSNGYTNGCLEADASSWISMEDCYSEGSGLNGSLGTLGSFSTQSLVKNDEPELAAPDGNLAFNLSPDAAEELSSTPASVSPVVPSNTDEENRFTLKFAQSSSHEHNPSNSSQDQLFLNSENCHSQSLLESTKTGLDPFTSDFGTNLSSPKNLEVSETDPNQDFMVNNDLTDASSHSVSSPSQDTSIELLKPTLVDVPNHPVASLEGQESDHKGSILCEKVSPVKVVHSIQVSDEAPQSRYHSLVVEPSIRFGINNNLPSDCQVSKPSTTESTLESVDSSVGKDAPLHPPANEVDPDLFSKGVSPSVNDVVSHTSNMDVDLSVSSPKSDTSPENAILSHTSNKVVDSGGSSKSVTSPETVVFPHTPVEVNLDISSKSDSPSDNASDNVALLHTSNNNADLTVSPEIVTPSENQTLSHTSNKDVDSGGSSPKSVTSPEKVDFPITSFVEVNLDIPSKSHSPSDKDAFSHTSNMNADLTVSPKFDSPSENASHPYTFNKDLDSSGSSSKSDTSPENSVLPQTYVQVSPDIPSKSDSPSHNVALSHTSNKYAAMSVSPEIVTPSENKTLSELSNKNVVLSHLSVEVNLAISPKIDSPSADQINAFADNKAPPLANLETANNEISAFSSTVASPRSLEPIQIKNVSLKPISEDSSRQPSEDSSHPTQFSQSNDTNDTKSSNQSTPRKKYEDRFPNFIQLETSSIDDQFRTPRKRTPRTLHNESTTPKPKKSKKPNPRQK